MTSPTSADKSSDAPIFPGPLDIGRAMAKGTGWTVGTQLIIQAIAMLSTMVLARLLVPADFGLVALATALSGALHAISEFSFDLALIQNQSAARREYDTAWTLSICRNAILAGVLAAGAGLIASAFGDERLERKHERRGRRRPQRFIPKPAGAPAFSANRQAISGNPTRTCSLSSTVPSQSIRPI
jgi:O-antigen/teichoic acid export membrane protein